MVDTGAKINVISKDVLKNMNIKIKDDKYSKKVSCANGSELKVQGKINFKVEFNSKSVIGEFFVAEEIYSNVIIAIDILSDLRIKLVEIDDNNVLVYKLSLVIRNL